MNNGCKDCQDRHVGCHSNCESYKEYLDDLKQRKNIIKEARKDNKEYRSYKRDRIKKDMRGKW